MSAKKVDPRVAKTYKLPPGLVARLEVRAKGLGMTYTGFVERALEAALGGDTRAASSAERLSGQHAHGDHASATGAVTARGASRPSAPPRAPVDPGVARAEAFRRASARR